MTAVYLNIALTYLLEIIKAWWWLPLPFLLVKPFIFFYYWWRVETWLIKQKMVMLEVKLPKEILKPVRAMEQVLASIHAAIYQPPDIWEKWVDGQVQLSISFEIVSKDGEPHFYIRTPVNYRDAVESSLYSQYPEIEITEVDDYTKYVPQSIPNKEWDLWGSDYRLIADDHLPIKTYKQFETEHETKEEKRVDPVATLFESMAKIKPGEQLWVQIMAEPIADADEIKFLGRITTKGSFGVWKKEGEALRDKLARREESSSAKKAQRPIIQDAITILATGKVPEEEKEEERKELIPPEMKLTPGEREILQGLEEKISKPVFKCSVRFIYMGKNEVFFKPNFRLAFAYFNGYTTQNLNALMPNGKTLSKIKKSFFLPLNLIRRRRLYVRQRKLFRNYIRRYTSFHPKPGGTCMLNIEEVASLFHFPGEASASAPGVPRVEAKKRGSSSILPTE